MTYVLLVAVGSRPAQPKACRHDLDRSSDGREVDFILETPQGKLVAIALKASVSPGGKAVQHLRWLREHLGDRMVAGVLPHLQCRSVSGLS